MLDKAKKLVENADDIIEENVEKLKNSKAFESIAETFDTAGDFIENKIEEIRQGGVKEKPEGLAGKTEDKAEEAFARLKDLGKKVADKAADKLEDIADNIRQKTEPDQKSENG